MNRIYGTIFNNRVYLPDVLASLEKLKPYKLYIVDNFSTDGSYEYLKTKKDVFIVQRHCKRGIGREIALKKLIREGNSNDIVFAMDFDSYFQPAFYNVIDWASKELRDGDIITFAEICRLSTARKLRWVNLNYGEDDEFNAHAYSILKGRKIFLADKKLIRINAGLRLNSVDNIKKNSRGISLFGRGLQAVIESHQGIAYKNWGGEAKTPAIKLANVIGHLLAKFKGVYSYDEKYANNEYIRMAATHKLIVTRDDVVLKKGYQQTNKDIHLLSFK